MDTQNAFGVSRYSVVRAALLILVSALFISSLVAVHFAGAAVSVVSDPTFGGVFFKQGGSSAAVLKVTIGSDEDTQALTGVKVRFTGQSGSPTWNNTAASSSELADLATTNGGVQLWRETAGTGFSAAADTQITLAASPVYAASNVFTLTPGSTTTLATGQIFYVVVKPDSSGLTNSTTFKATIPADGIITSTSSPTILAATSSMITVDTAAPTVDFSMTGPQNNSTNVPISAFIGVGFSEQMDPSTLTPSNITMTAAGSPVSIAVNPNFNNVNIVPSSAPTYAASSRFAKFPTAGVSSFMFSSATNPIFFNGSYFGPALGDIIYFQHESFPAELGIVTNATQTSGTFSVNGTTLFGGQQLIKVAAATQTGLVTAIDPAFKVGDLVVVKTATNSGDTTRTNWHVVTTAGAISSSTLRFDGGSGAPTYPTAARYSLAASTASSTSVLAVSQGDLVFANVGTTTYSWHLATTAGDLSADATSTAVLDGNSTTTSRVAGGSVMVRLATTVQAAVTDNVLALANGDIVFAKATANASPLNTYSFHLVSGPGTISSANLRFDNSVSPLTTNTAYVVTVGPAVSDKAGNALGTTSTVSFTTGATGGTNIAPPFVQSTAPNSGSQSHPINAPIKLTFSQAMGSSALSSSNVTLYTDNFGAPGTPITATRSLDAASTTLTVTPSSNLTASTGYILKVGTTTLSYTGTALNNTYFLNFKTPAGSADSSHPTANGVFPSAGATAVKRNTIVCSGMSKDIDASTVTASTVTLSGSIAVNVSYSPNSRTICASPTSQLASNTTYTFTITSGVTDIIGNALDADSGTGGNQNFTSTFTTDSATDSTGPSVTFGNADNFGAAITFSEPMQSGGGANAADNISNYTVESPVGTSISLSGKTVTYDGMMMAARISGLSLTTGATIKITASTALQDLAGNAILTTGTPAANTTQFTVANSNTTGGCLNCGTSQQNPNQAGTMPIRATPTNRSAGATSNYEFEFPVSQVVPLGGKILVTFPVGFDVTNAVAATVGTESFANGDLNGPNTGTITIGSVAVNASARTITVTTAGAASTANDFLRFTLKGIVNSTAPSSNGYTVTILTQDTSSVTKENMTSNPFYLGQSGSAVVVLNVFVDNGAGGATAGDNIKSGTEAGVANIRAFLGSPASGGIEATSGANGTTTFSGLAVGDYMLGIAPDSVAAAGDYVFNSAPQPISISSGTTTKNLGLTAAAFTIAGTITGPANTKVDVFASSPSGFTKKTGTTNGGGTFAYSLPVNASTTYQVGVGPAMPPMTPGQAAPPAPTFTFMPPPNITVQVLGANITGKNFTLTAAGKTITGYVRDSAGTGISGVQVFARPTEGSTTGGGGSSVGFGTSAQTQTDGSFTLNVVAGNYLVNANKPGMPFVPDLAISVPTSGTNVPASLSFVMAISTSGLTISGTVKDDGGNAISYAGVSAEKITSTSDTTSLGGGAQNFVGGPTDSAGSYTLYVSAGTWRVSAFAPGFGKLGTKTITVGTTAVTGQDFSAATVTFGTITGSVTKGGVAQQGANVRAEGDNGGNMATTDASGAYSIKVPPGSYTVSCFIPGVGDSVVTGSVTVSANTTTSGKNCAPGASLTVVVGLTDGTTGITNAFVDARDTNGRGNGTNVSVASGTLAVYTLQLSPGTYTIRAAHPAFGPIGAQSNVNTSTTLSFTATAGTQRTVAGTVTANASNVEGAWVSLTGTPAGQTNKIHIGTQTASNGTYTLTVPDGSYDLRADKQGLKSPAESSVTVAGANLTAQNVVLTTASRTITGTVTIGGSGVSQAFVDATDGAGGFAVSQTDSTGAYSLAVDNGTWTVRGHADGYNSDGVPVTVNSNSPSGIAVALTAISGYTPKPLQQQTFTPASGGQFTNNDIGSGFKLTMPPASAGSDTNPSTIATKPTTNVPKPTTGSVLTKNAVTVNVTNSSGQEVSSLNSDVTITVPYTAADLPTGVSESSIQLGYWNESANSWTTLPTTVDTVNDVLTATVSHFSDFAPLIPSDPTAPETPASITATALNATTVRLAWDSVSGANSYDVYQSSSQGGTYARVGSEPTVGNQNGYDVTGLTNGSTYYFKVSALNAGGNESAASSAVSVTLTAASIGGGGSTSGGGGGGGSYGTAVTIPTSPSVTANTPSAVSLAQQLATLQLQLQARQQVGAVSAGIFTRMLKTGSEGNDVVALQNILEAKGFLKMPAGIAKGYFGNATMKALMQYQTSVGLEAVGYAGPGTRAALSTEAGGSTSVSAPAPAATVSGSYTFTVMIKTGAENADVIALQNILEAKGFLKIPAGTAKGYFGNATKQALMKYQESVGLEAVGYVGPGTRAALNTGR